MAPLGTGSIFYILLKLSSCMYVCSRNTAKTVHDSAKILGPPYSPYACSVQYRFLQIGQRKNYLKNQFPIQSSTLREYLINANNLSGIVRWSYLFFFLIWFILKSQTFSIDKERFIFKHKIYRYFNLILPCSLINKIVLGRLRTIISLTFFSSFFFFTLTRNIKYCSNRAMKKILKK